MPHSGSAICSNENACPPKKKFRTNSRTRGFLLSAASRLTLRSAVFAPVLSLAAPILSPAYAQQDEVQIGDSVLEPATETELTIKAIFEGAVLTGENVLVILDPSIGGAVPDPVDASQFVEVTAISVNPTTGLVETVTLADSRVIPVARDVSDQFFQQIGGDPLAQYMPLPAADENLNTVSNPYNGSDGDDGDNNLLTSQGRDGDNGARRSPDVERSYSAPREAISGRAIYLRGYGGDGGDGAGGITLGLVSFAGGDAGSGGGGTNITLNSSADVSTNGGGRNYGLYVRSQGGDGGNGGNGLFSLVNTAGGDGGNGGDGGAVVINNQVGGNVTTYANDSYGVYGLSVGGVGGNGGDAAGGISATAGSAGSAGDGGTVQLNNYGKIHTFGNASHGMLGQSLGGTGGSGGDAGGLFAYSGSGSGGGDGDTVDLYNRSGGFIYTGGNDAHGLLAQSIGGGGGAGGSSFGLVALGGNAGAGKDAGETSVNNYSGATIVTTGSRSFGMLAQSIGGGGGSTGIAASLVSIGGNGGAGGRAEDVTGYNSGRIATFGYGSHGILTQSIGGGGGSGSTTIGALFSLGADGAAAGAGGTSTITNYGVVTTAGFGAHALMAQSIGGGGGSSGGSGGAVAIGGRSSTGGNGGTVTVTNNGTLATQGIFARGILAQSIGGGGGSASGAGGLITIGGRGSGGGEGRSVTVTNTGYIQTEGALASAIVAQSIGGGGGDGGDAGGVLFTLGGRAGGGGKSSTVTVNQSGSIATQGMLSHGIVAQSVGGGGGNGGTVGSGSAFAGVAIGGRGGSGGAGGTVNVNFDPLSRTIDGVSRDVLPSIITEGTGSIGLVAQSVGGGGGNGGLAVQATLGVFGAVSVAVGGSGGSGGKGGTVNIDGDAFVQTKGDFAAGIVAQAVGGGGGNGGGTVAVAGSVGAGVSGSIAVGVGGSGGSGGDGGTVTLTNGGFVGTNGYNSNAIIAQSIGGGGGNGGFNVSVAAAGSDSVAVSIPVGVGGTGGLGGMGGTVDATFAGNILTRGDASHGLLAQSIGGGGGNGGFNVSGALSASGAVAGAGAIGVGGSGGEGGFGGEVTTSFAGNIATYGAESIGHLAQSIGGGGGNGAFNVSGAIAGSAAAAVGLSVGVGGAGGGASDGNIVMASHTGNVSTFGNESIAILAQSAGGGGGNGAFNVSGAVGLSASGAGAISVGVGGSGGDGGNGDEAKLAAEGNFYTGGDESSALVVQSIGGGGGNGAVNVTGNIAASASGSGSIGVGVGGSGGLGGDAQLAELIFDGSIATEGDDSTGALVQSLGGGGGNGAVNVTGNITASATTAVGVSVGVGGMGGGGGNAASSMAAITGDIMTSGAGSDGVNVQSLGGGGGNGGVNVSASVALSSATSVGPAIGVGGFGGGAGNGAFANLIRVGDTIATGADSDAIIVQSLGGGGGNGGVNVASALTFGTTSIAGTVGIGGFGGGGGDAGLAQADITGSAIATGIESDLIESEDDIDRRVRSGGSTGLLVQSVGGGGGNGGINVSGGVSFAAGPGGKTLNFGLGGFGGAGGDGGEVSLVANGPLYQGAGDNNAGILAQSVGGGGGNGALNVSAGIAVDGQLTIGIGGFGGDGGIGGTVTSNVIGNAMAAGEGATGILAQSLGGGGGNGGVNVSGGITYGSSGSTPTAVFGLGGFGGDGNRAGTVTASHAGNISVEGIDSVGLMAQSLGGGGGNGTFNVAGNISANRGLNVAIGVGGTGGAGADGNIVSLTSAGAIFVDGRGLDDTDLEASERDDGATGIIAQSIGGGGGNGGFNIAGAGTNMGAPLTIGIGGSGENGGVGGEVTLTRTSGLVEVLGDNATGILAQSLGGGGGNAGVNLLLSGSLRAKFDAQFALGGSGGEGADGGLVTVIHDGGIALSGDNSTGLIAQSIGGGGGNANLNINASLAANKKGKDGGANPDTKTFDFAIGGAPGNGSEGGDVNVTHGGWITTSGNNSTALLAQSIGGGGGNAASSISNNISGSPEISVAIGRRGGTGAAAGNVTVAINGELETFGDGSHGLHAQSIGGGGGTSETTAVSVDGDREKNSGDDSQKAKTSGSFELAIGLEGGVGAVAGNVAVTATDRIVTWGNKSHGIFAQSIGGGGGAGGAAFVDKTQEIPLDDLLFSDDDSQTTSLSFAMQLGGDGGSGAASGTVSVTNTGIVGTLGDGSHAIFAQAIGGGGGEGGMAFNIATSAEGKSGGIEIAAGGDGGTGAVAQGVTVANDGLLQTVGEESHAIFAQSIGGGGGNAGLTGNFNLARPQSDQDKSYALIYNRGGTGGTGGSGGEVTVSNGLLDPANATILTSGDQSHGIFAQSIGGGGGNGSSILSGNVSTGKTNYLLGLNFGGTGGVGGVGGLVTVDNAGLIQTTGAEAHGILAQSIGGGGGNGGLALAIGNLWIRGRANEPGPIQPMLSLGGDGGEGNDAGNVVVNNSGQIITHGDGAHGIVAQSIGGGGGNAGFGISLQTNTAVNVLSNALNVLLGGRGADGGEGGQVTVNHSGDITVFGDNARPILAESINGGGGGVILDFDGITSTPGGDLFGFPGFEEPEGIATPAIFTLFAGSQEVFGAESGLVTINTTGTFGAAGDNGAAFSAQAVGGGGGRIELDLGFAAPEDALARTGLEVGLGGNDSGDNGGGNIVSTHEGELISEGRNTPGIILQSIGGGGGSANIGITNAESGLGNALFRLGGIGMVDSPGGNVSHAQIGSITTLGDLAPGIFVQSIGGGGGTLNLFVPDSESQTMSSSAPSRSVAAIAVPLNGALTLGVDGGGGLDGGDIVFDLAGDVVTQGDNSAALLFQSIGAGGGRADVEGFDDVAVTLGGSNGASGNGGIVSITSQGNIVTEGVNSHALVIQSIGGGGGIVNGAGGGELLNLSADNSGDGGAITLDQTGAITTTGAGSTAVFLQSLGGGGGIVGNSFAGTAGGDGQGGAITVNLDGDVMALANGSTAIHLQSLGNNPGIQTQSTHGPDGGNITLTIGANSAVVGGEDAPVILIEGGADNLLTNNGTILGLGGISGFAVNATDGNDVLVNNGSIIGNIALGSGANSMLNATGATFISDAMVDLGGATNVFTNAGVLAPGDSGTIASTALDGSFVQTSEGITYVEVDLGSRTFDSIDATGTVSVGGALDVTLLNQTAFRPGLFSAEIFSGAGGASMDAIDLRADSSVVLRLLGVSTTASTVQVDYDISFAPPESAGNRAFFGEYLNRVQTEGVAEALQPTFTQLIQEQNVDNYLDQLTQLGGEFYVEQNAQALMMAQGFSRQMANCGSHAASAGQEDEDGLCVWLRADLTERDLDAQLQMPAIDSETTSIAGGAKYAVGEDLAMVLSIGYDDFTMAGYGDRWGAKGDAIRGGLGLEYRFGDSRLGTYFSVSNSSFQTMRDLPSFGGTAMSDRDLLTLVGELAFAHEFDLGVLEVTPALTLGMASLTKGDTTEAGATPNDLRIGKTSKLHGWATPSLQLSYPASIGEGLTLRPFVNGSLRYSLTQPEVRIDGIFAADSSGAGGFKALTPLDRTSFSGEAGFELVNEGRFSISGSYRLDRSSNRDGETFTLRAGLRF